MASFATGKYALGICDRCGFQYDLNVFRELTVRQKKTGLKVCKECWEADHPQNMQGVFKVVDPEALRNPLPDTDRVYSTGVFGWNPVMLPQISIRLGAARGVNP